MINANAVTAKINPKESVLKRPVLSENAFIRMERKIAIAVTQPFVFDDTAKEANIMVSKNKVMALVFLINK